METDGKAEMQTSSYYIGVDMGSSSAKLILIDQAGRQLAQSSREYGVGIQRQNAKEIDPAVWFETVKAAMKELLSGIERSRVECIGFTGQMHTTIFLDADGNSIRPAIMWNDSRADDETAAIKRRLEEMPQLEYLRHVVANGCAASSLLWLKRHEPDNFAKLGKFLIGSDYLVLRFCCKMGTDYCEASTSGLYDLRTNDWSDDMLRLIGVRPDQCPAIHASAHTMGTILPALAAELGLPETVRIITGTGDNPAASIATGCLIGNYPTISIGTSGVIVFPQKTVDLTTRFKKVLLSLNGKEFRAIVQGTVQSAGNCLSWLVRNILHENDYDVLKSVDRAEDFMPRLLFYPHFVGEKAVRFDPDARGAFLGIGTDTTQRQLVLAVVEGVCFGFREIFDVMGVSLSEMQTIKVMGGGAKNSLWLQVLADVLNLRVERMEICAGPAYGIALVAAQSSRNPGFDDFDAVTPTIAEVIEPERQFVELYNQKYAYYRRIYPAIRSIFHPEDPS
ncbi:MAG: FGGY family carbohydrate kinase [Clostridiales bacterium]|nr:FGGY family carbohydrate kinase [Clostridiales bacterium]MDY2835523.1 FGGY family carbohydrate kinase [Candidatus Aphodomonas sp.]